MCIFFGHWWNRAQRHYKISENVFLINNLVSRMFLYNKSSKQILCQLHHQSIWKHFSSLHCRISDEKFLSHRNKSSHTREQNKFYFSNVRVEKTSFFVRYLYIYWTFFHVNTGCPRTQHQGKTGILTFPKNFENEILFQVIGKLWTFNFY